MRVHIRVPKRGDSTKLVELAVNNAIREAERATTKEEKLRGALDALRQMLQLETQPGRIEAYDVSNLSGTDIVASMVVFQDGKPLRSAYKRFQVKGFEDQDDYASMRQVLHRRFAHFLSGDKGFEKAPDILLIDGGVNHAKTVFRELSEMGVRIPIFGMVKDDRHRTRALVTPEGAEIGIAGKQSVFALIGSIQEETHRFAITYQRSVRSRRVKGSTLDKIPGVGEKRRTELLKRFKTISAIRGATLQELQSVLPRDAAMSVFQYFHGEEQT